MSYLYEIASFCIICSVIIIIILALYYYYLAKPIKAKKDLCNLFCYKPGALLAFIIVELLILLASSVTLLYITSSNSDIVKITTISAATAAISAGAAALAGVVAAYSVCPYYCSIRQQEKPSREVEDNTEEHSKHNKYKEKVE